MAVPAALLHRDGPAESLLRPPPALDVGLTMLIAFLWPLPMINRNAISISYICCSRDDFDVWWQWLITWLMFYNHVVCIVDEVLFWLAGPLLGDGAKLQGGRERHLKTQM